MNGQAEPDWWFEAETCIIPAKICAAPSACRPPLKIDHTPSNA